MHNIKKLYGNEIAVTEDNVYVSYLESARKLIFTDTFFIFRENLRGEEFRWYILFSTVNGRE